MHNVIPNMTEKEVRAFNDRYNKLNKDFDNGRLSLERFSAHLNKLDADINIYLKEHGFITELLMRGKDESENGLAFIDQKIEFMFSKIELVDDIDLEPYDD